MKLHRNESLSSKTHSQSSLLGISSVQQRLYVQDENTNPDNSLLTHYQRELQVCKAQLRDTRSLIKLSMSSNSSFNESVRSKLVQHFQSLENFQAHYHSVLDQASSQALQTPQGSKIESLSSQNQEFQRLVAKQEEYLGKLIDKVKSKDSENAALKEDNCKLLAIIEELQSQVKALASDKAQLEKVSKTSQEATDQESRQAMARVAQLSSDLEKARVELTNSKDQNKKLVELLHKLEKKVNEKADREEQLEEECLQLKEQLGLMASQVEKIEDSVERRVKEIRDKDEKIRALQKEVDRLRKELASGVTKQRIESASNSFIKNSSEVYAKNGSGKQRESVGERNSGLQGQQMKSKGKQIVRLESEEDIEEKSQRNQNEGDEDGEEEDEDEDEDEDELILMARQKLLELKRDLSDDEQDFQDTSMNLRRQLSSSESEEEQKQRESVPSSLRHVSK